MTRVAEQARDCQCLHRLVELGFPQLGEVLDDHTCWTAREVLRLALTAEAARRRRTTTLADVNNRPGPSPRRDEGRALWLQFIPGVGPATCVDAVGFIEGSRPDRGLMPRMEQLPLWRVRELVSRAPLPPTDAVPLRSSHREASFASVRRGGLYLS